jgi:hypothetical protein
MDSANNNLITDGVQCMGNEKVALHSPWVVTCEM